MIKVFLKLKTLWLIFIWAFSEVLCFDMNLIKQKKLIRTPPAEGLTLFGLNFLNFSRCFLTQPASLKQVTMWCFDDIWFGSSIVRLCSVDLNSLKNCFKLVMVLFQRPLYELHPPIRTSVGRFFSLMSLTGPHSNSSGSDKLVACWGWTEAALHESHHLHNHHTIHKSSGWKHLVYFYIHLFRFVLSGGL